MPAPVSDDDHKRRARRRLIGAVALAIIAVILLPLVLEDEPPPAGPFEVQMPPTAAPATEAGRVQYAPPPANASVEPPDIDKANAADTSLPDESPAPPRPAAPVVARKEPVAVAPEVKPHPPAAPTPAVHYTVQVGVFADKANVERLEARIAAMGLKSYTQQVGHATRLRVGDFPSRDEADRAANKLQKADIPAKVMEK